jgi:hypothetical protein
MSSNACARARSIPQCTRRCSLGLAHWQKRMSDSSYSYALAFLSFGCLAMLGSLASFCPYGIAFQLVINMYVGMYMYIYVYMSIYINI